MISKSKLVVALTDLSHARDLLQDHAEETVLSSDPRDYPDEIAYWRENARKAAKFAKIARDALKEIRDKAEKDGKLK